MSFFVQGTEENGGQPAFEPFKYRYVNKWGYPLLTPDGVKSYIRLNDKGYGYEGYVDEKGLKQGKGVKIELSTHGNRTETRYEGNFINDSLYGEGTLTVIDAMTKIPLLKYTGNFEKNAKCGPGKLTDYEKGLELEGEFEDDVFVQGTWKRYDINGVKNKKSELNLDKLIQTWEGGFKKGELNDLEGNVKKYENGKMIQETEGVFEEGFFLRGVITTYTGDGRVEQTDKWDDEKDLWVREIYDAGGNLKSEYGFPQYMNDLPYGKGYEIKYKNEKPISLYKGMFFNGLYNDREARFAELSDIPDETYVYEGLFRKGVFLDGTKRILKGGKDVDTHTYSNGKPIFPEAQM